MTATLDIPLLNHRLETVDATEAQHMFDAGVPMPPESFRDDAWYYQRIRRSADLRWVVRSTSVAGLQGLCGLSAETITDLHLREINEYQHFGLQVISFAIAPVNEAKKILTVSPWIDGMRRCTRRKFEEAVAPIASLYIEEWGNRPGPKPNVHEMNHPRQYSTAAITGETPFLHDIGPPLDLVLT